MRRFLLMAAEDLQPGGRLDRMAPYHLAGLAWASRPKSTYIIDLYIAYMYYKCIIIYNIILY